MTKTPLINEDISVRVAQESVHSSVERFGHALEKLANKVGDSANTIQHVKEIAQKPHDLYVGLKEKADEAVALVRKNPAPYAVAVAGIAVALGIFLWVRAEDPHWEFPRNIGI